MSGSRKEESGRLPRGAGVSIAYRRRRGKGPAVVFLGGFMSDMTGVKAEALSSWCGSHGRAFLRFDYRGHGESDGQFEEGTVGLWLEDALAALDGLTEGKLVLVGSSMGGWIALLAARARAERVAGLVLIAPAPDFTEDLVWKRLEEPARLVLETEGVLYEPSEYGDKPLAITKALIEDGRRHLLLRGAIELGCPVRILHGQLDPDVPWQRSLTLAEKLTARDVRVTLIKDGDHRLSRPQDLALLTQAVGEIEA
jgi:pimeloyl-ACP methyl ester carboxylesterase